jgi:hypothetical protein
MSNAIQEHLRGWIPAKLTHPNRQLLLQWLYTGAQPYTEPFFDESMMKCMHFPQNSKPYKCTSTAEMFCRWSHEADSVVPTAFIFHVSRCGSTLVSQALGMLPQHISLAEVPLFDDILRLGYKHPQYDADARAALLQAAIRLYGARRSGVEERLFIKGNCWDVFFYNELRKLYPNTPFIIMYRSPEAVIHSNQIKKGMQGIYGLIEPAILGLENLPPQQQHPDVYIALVLEKIYQAIINIHRTDSNTLLLNYNQGLPLMMQQIAAFTGMPISDEYKAAIAERSQYNAKYPNEKFTERAVDLQVDADVLQRLQLLYEEIDGLRLQAPATIH